MSNSGKVLVVDDEPDFTEFLEWQLKKNNYRVMTANSGETGYNLIVSHIFDVLIADIRMPGMSGIELIEKALKRQPDLQCIVITGHGDIDTAIEAMRVGAVNYLRKPAGIDEIQIAIVKAMEKLRLIIENREKNIELQNANRELKEIRKELELALNNETANRFEAEKEIDRLKLRNATVELLHLSLRCWKNITKKSKFDFAEESRLWSAVVDSNGTYRTRTLDKYLKTSTLPQNPRFNDVLDSAYFTLSTCSPDNEIRKDIESRITSLEQMLNNSV